MVTAGLLGRKTGRGFYTYEAPDSPVVVADDQTPSADDKPQLRHDITQVGVVGTGTMASRHRRGLRQERATTCSSSAARQDKVDGVVAAITKNFDKQIQRGKATEEAKAEVLGRLSRHDRRSTTSRSVDIVVEAIAEDLAIKTTLFENLDEICKPGAILATTTSACRSSPAPRRRRAPRTSSACTSSTRHRS